jgi:hypothetical protein
LAARVVTGSGLRPDGRDMNELVSRLQDSIQELDDVLEDVLRHQKALSCHSPFKTECGSVSHSIVSMVPISSLMQQVADSIFKRSNQNVEIVYLKYAKDHRGVCQDDFYNACKEVRFDFVSREDTDELFVNMDMNDDSFLDFSEFRRAMGTRSASEQFILQTVPLHEIISSALPRKHGVSPMETFRELTRYEITEIAHAVSGVLETMLVDKVSQLRDSWDAAKAKGVHNDKNNDKFLVVELKAGNIQDYHNGLSGRVGEVFLSSVTFELRYSDMLLQVYRILNLRRL